MVEIKSSVPNSEAVNHSEKLQASLKNALSHLEQKLQSPEETFLRKHQMSVINSLHEFFLTGGTACYLSEPSGTGKTAVMAYLADALGLKTVIVSPTQQILEQTHTFSREHNPDITATKYYAYEKDTSGRIISTTYQSLPALTGGDNNNDKSPGKKINPEEVEMVLLDEAHLGLGEKRHALYRRFPNAIFIGLTATPYFDPLESLIERGIVEENERWTGIFKNRVHEMTLEEAMERKILADLDIYVIKTNTEVEKLEIMSNGEYRQTDLEKYFTTKSRNALATAMVCGIETLPENLDLSDEQKKNIKTIHQQIAGKRTVIFGISIEHADLLAKQLQTNGIKAASVHNKTSPEDRKKILAAYKRGEIQVILGVDMLRTGWDSPETEVSIHLRPTYSGVVKKQEVGRVLRQSPQTGKTRAIAIEFVDMVSRRIDSPVLITDIFDPEYVIKGVQQGKEPSVSVYEDRNKPIITIRGMNISSIIQTANSRELLLRKFKDAGIVEIYQVLTDTLSGIAKENPMLGLYELYERMDHALPRFPTKIRNLIIEESKNPDEEIAGKAKNALLLINAGTILSAVNYFDRDGTESIEEKNEMLAVAIDEIIDKPFDLQKKQSISVQIYYKVRKAIALYISEREGIPPSIIINPNFNEIRSVIEDMLLKNKYPSRREVRDLLKSINALYKTSWRDAYQYFQALSGTLSLPDSTSSEMDTALMLENREVAETIKDTLESSGLAENELEVIKKRLGLHDGREWTLEEIGKEKSMSKERIRQIEAKAYRKLRHPFRSKEFRKLRETSQIPTTTMKNIDVLPKNPIGLIPLHLSYGDEIKLRQAGFKNIGQLLIARKGKIRKRLSQEDIPADDNPLAETVIQSLTTLSNIVLRDLYQTNKPPDTSSLQFLKQITDIIIKEDPNRIKYVGNDSWRLILEEVSKSAGMPKQNNKDIESDYQEAKNEYQARVALLNLAISTFLYPERIELLR